MNQPVKLSPIHQAEEKWQGQFEAMAGWRVAQLFRSVEAETAVALAAVALCDQSHNGKIRVEGQTAGQLLQAETLAVSDGKQTPYGHVYRLRRDLFFVHHAVEGVEETAVALCQHAQTVTGLITVTDVTHGNAELWLVGPRSAELLSRLCGLDFHDSRFPNHTARQSSVAKTTQLIIRRDLPDQAGLQTVPAYAMIGARSFGMYLWQTILQAGHDLGIEPIGWAAWVTLQKGAEETGL